MGYSPFGETIELLSQVQMQLLGDSWSSDTKKDQNRAIQPEYVFVRKTADAAADLCLRNSCDFIYHQTAESLESICGSWSNG